MPNVFSSLIRRSLSSILLLLASAAFNNQMQAQTNFLAAADFSDLAFFQSRGVVYKDAGQVVDGIQILKNHGINCVRLRLWTSSATQAAADPYNYGNNEAYTIPLAVRVKNAGLLFSLDFHYSDTWADPGNQATPSAWTNLDFTQLVAQMRSYNSNTIADFATAGAMPDFVQIGNEITAGMLWPSGKVSGTGGTPWSNLGQLMNAAIQGIQDATNALSLKMPRIIVHIDSGGDWSTTEWFFDNLNAQAVPYDIIGLSYYPFFQGPLTNLNTCLGNAAIRYGKPIIIAEDAFPWTNTMTSWTNALYGYAPTVSGQVSFIAALAKVVKSLPNGLGAGVFYWGAECQAVSGVNEAGFNTSSFFDTQGNLLPVADAVAGIGAPLVISPSLTAANLQLKWPFSGAAAQLTGSSNLLSATSWVAVSNIVSITGTAFTVTLPVTNGYGFYQLQSH